MQNTKKRTGSKRTRTFKKRATKTIKSDNYLLFKHKNIYQKEGTYGMSTYTNKFIPKDTIIIKEIPHNLTTTSKHDPDYVFKLIKHILDTFPNEYISMVPTKLDHTTVIDYSTIQHQHRQYLPELSEDQMKLYYMKYRRNAFGFGENPGILFYGTRLNHSCEPNVRYHKEKNAMVFKTTRDIQPNEEIFDSYINYMEPREFRQRELLRRYGFECKCTKCNREK
jgi:hypothetical protein